MMAPGIVLAAFALLGFLINAFNGEFPPVHDWFVLFCLLFLMPIGWIFIGHLLWQRFKCRGSPLAIVSSREISLPFCRPERLLWTDIRTVEISHFAGRKFIRFVLCNPDEILSPRQRRKAWPFSDSVLVLLDIFGSGEKLHVAAVKAHAQASLR
ncbi:hypothetical protein IC614_06130 [Allosphingosinicella flava]|uniref:Uncharacterized protein n=1 Tax=Allosphingosinicella flava TaxID=2771430 RepID=A0A7T2LN94_9SPHN|nr:hypothetical protein [Sphingosinicella flava]QPQ56138.1 hypothetical protein IC614_06130 [Sphingosinicella flava]